MLHVQDNNVKSSADLLLSEISKANENYKTKNKLVSGNCSKGIQQMKRKHLFKNKGRSSYFSQSKEWKTHLSHDLLLLSTYQTQLDESSTTGGCGQEVGVSSSLSSQLSFTISHQKASIFLIYSKCKLKRLNSWRTPANIWVLFSTHSLLKGQRLYFMCSKLRILRSLWSSYHLVLRADSILEEASQENQRLLPGSELRVLPGGEAVHKKRALGSSI